MPSATIAGQEVQVDDEGFMTSPDEWNPELCSALAEAIGIEALSDRHWEAINFLRVDFEEQGETPTLRRVNKACGIPTKELFALFPKKPAKKMAYCAGLPKPRGCV